MIYCFIDVETTGVDPLENGIHQIAGAIFQSGKVLEKFDFKVRPHKGTKINLEALSVTPDVTKDIIKKYPKPKVIHKQLIEVLSKHIDKFDKNSKAFLVGYNINFDHSFLRNWFLDCGDKYFGSWFWSNPIDVMSLAGECLNYRRAGIENFKLGTVCQAMGLPVNTKKQHKPLYDVLLTVDLYKAIKLNNDLPF